jgi:hypothetical protein
MKKILLLCLFFAICLSNSSKKEKDILELIKISHQPLDSVIYQTIQLMEAMDPIFSDDDKDIDWESLTNDVMKVISEDEYYRIYVPMYDKYFSHSDITFITSFVNDSQSISLSSSEKIGSIASISCIVW